MKWQTSAPSNIALIKYMGKTDSNLPTNPSLSYTLEHLRTFVEIELLPEGNLMDQWQPLPLPEKTSFELSAKAQNRFLNHLGFLKRKFNFNGSFLVRSNNNFPSDCGLASSASSFAALTICTYKAAKELNPDLDLTLYELANLSRQGSGSSGRSFFSPWSIWDSQGPREIDLPFKNLLHQVIIVSDQTKNVSSSEAHQRIKSSLLAPQRPQRAQTRLEELMRAMQAKDWKRCYEIIWADFWDMQALFETSQPPFGYLTEASLRALRICKEPWLENNDGPWITMDAGPNVHLLYRQEQKELALRLENKLKSHFKVISNWASFV